MRLQSAPGPQVLPASRVCRSANVDAVHKNMNVYASDMDRFISDLVLLLLIISHCKEPESKNFKQAARPLCSGVKGGAGVGRCGVETARPGERAAHGLGERHCVAQRRSPRTTLAQKTMSNSTLAQDTPACAAID
jgi:hypothetical protein